MLTTATQRLARLSARQHVAAARPFALAPPARSLCTEVKYQRLTPVKHVLTRPGMYVGPTAAHAEQLWVWNARARRMVFRRVRYVPALYKVFDEILVNALDNHQVRPVPVPR